jgi:multiple sugar transport system permease protein
MAPIFAIVGLLAIYPLIYSVKMSLLAVTLYSDRGFVGLKNYVKILTSPDFHNSLLVTLVFIGSATAVQLVWGLGLAMVLNRLSGRIISGIRAAVVIPVMTTSIAVASMWRLMYFPEGGIINTIFATLGLQSQTWLNKASSALSAVVLVEVWQFTPFTALILFAGRRTISKELYEAAAIDGASDAQMFRYITLMILRPLIALCLIFNVMRQFKAFAIIFGLTKGGPGRTTQLISYYLYLTAYRFYKISDAATASLLLLVLIIGLGIIFLRYVRKFY